MKENKTKRGYKEISPTEIRHKVEEIQRQQRIKKLQEKKWDWLYGK